jgi:Caspase domain
LRSTRSVLFPVLILLGLHTSGTVAKPPVPTPLPASLPVPASAPEAYQHYFVQYVDTRSLPEKVLNLVGLTNDDVGRSFALVAGVDTYPNLGSENRPFEAARVDIEGLVGYLRDVEHFDEIVLLRNADVTIDNFTYFFQTYFPDRLKEFPKSRFVFAYSGHGMQDGPRGFLLKANAKNKEDRANSINLETLATIYRETTDAAFQSLALINACYSGAFTRRTFGDRRLLPREPGAHVITAGAANELTRTSAVGAGSVFFEKVFSGLDGHADKEPEQADGSLGDGIITAKELYSYLDQEIQLETQYKQHPTFGDFSADGSLGSFFFFDRRKQTKAGMASTWTLESSVRAIDQQISKTSFGEAGTFPGEDTFIITSSRADESSYESDEHQNSYFAYFLMDALSRWHEPPTLTQVYDFLSLRVSETVAEKKHQPQHPQMFPPDLRNDARICAKLDHSVSGGAREGLRASTESHIGTKYALIVGVGRFRDPMIPSLHFGAKDASDLAELLTSSKCDFPAGNVNLLTDNNATRAGILTSLQMISLVAGEDDLVLLYFDSHGSPVRPEAGLEGAGYFVTNDTQLSELLVNAIPFDELSRLVSAIKARTKVIFVDTAYSGQLGSRGRANHGN